jgi:hypothetical protein
MKRLSPYWFLQGPLDPEHKYYVLMDFLQELRKDLKQRSTKKCAKEVFLRLDDLKNFKNNRSLSPERIEEITKKDEKIKTSFFQDPDYQKNLEVIDQIIEESQDILYNFGEEMLSVLKNLEKLVEVKELFPVVNQESSENSFSLLLIRSTKTNKIDAYLMKESIINQDGQSLSGIIMKKVQMEYDYKYSKDYEFIIHEVLDRIKSKLYTPRVFIAEIDAELETNDELVKIAKEKAIKLF